MFEITDDFLAQAGFDMLSAESKERMRHKIEKSVSARITRKVILAVGEQNLDAFEKLLDGGDASALMDWCQEQGIDLAQITQEAMNETMVELQTLHNKALEALQQ